MYIYIYIYTCWFIYLLVLLLLLPPRTRPVSKHSCLESEPGLSGLSQNNNFREHSRRKQNTTKLGIWGGTKFRGNLV